MYKENFYATECVGSPRFTGSTLGPPPDERGPPEFFQNRRSPHEDRCFRKLGPPIIMGMGGGDTMAIGSKDFGYFLCENMSVLACFFVFDWVSVCYDSYTMWMCA